MARPSHWSHMVAYDRMRLGFLQPFNCNVAVDRMLYCRGIQCRTCSCNAAARPRLRALVDRAFSTHTKKNGRCAARFPERVVHIIRLVPHHAAPHARGRWKGFYCFPVASQRKNQLSGSHRYKPVASDSFSEDCPFRRWSVQPCNNIPCLPAKNSQCIYLCTRGNKQMHSDRHVGMCCMCK